jgi:hypothetical protein
MFEWLNHNKELFLVNYTDVGFSQQMALELQDDHHQFRENAMVRRRRNRMRYSMLYW